MNMGMLNEITDQEAIQVVVVATPQKEVVLGGCPIIPAKSNDLHQNRFVVESMIVEPVG
jgi:hypothetical protein